VKVGHIGGDALLREPGAIVARSHGDPIQNPAGAAAPGAQPPNILPNIQPEYFDSYDEYMAHILIFCCFRFFSIIVRLKLWHNV